MALADKTLTCRDCGATFQFTVGEQEFYHSRGLQNEPTRCPDCRTVRRRDRYGNRGYPRVMHPVVCASCGLETEVPFEPRQDRPVYCSDCYAKMKKAQ